MQFHNTVPLYQTYGHEGNKNISASSYKVQICPPQVGQIISVLSLQMQQQNLYSVPAAEWYM
jgi:hypothetical protein